MGEIPIHNPEEEIRKTVIKDSVIDRSEIPGSIEIRGKVIIDNKEVNENSPEAKNARELLNRWKKVKEGKLDEQSEISHEEVKIPTVKELMDKGIDKKTAQRMVREQMEDQQDFKEASKGIELLAQLKKAKREGEQRRCAKCNSLIESNAKFCSTCGGKVENEKPKNCPKCGGESPSSAKFCGSCGNKL